MGVVLSNLEGIISQLLSTMNSDSFMLHLADNLVIAVDTYSISCVT
jgi:hypothetical protein